jgi:regulator of protease activity HflC (stomatin/prohibitin superfamily)
MTDVGTTFIVLAVIVVAILLLFLSRSFTTILPFQVGILTLFGSFRGALPPGLNFVHPLGHVIRVDMRAQQLSTPRQQVVTKDNLPVVVDALITFRVVDAPKSIFMVADLRGVMVAAAGTAVRTIIGEMTLGEIPSSRARTNGRLIGMLSETAQPWGIIIESAEIRDASATPDPFTGTASPVAVSPSKVGGYVRGAGPAPGTTTGDHPPLSAWPSVANMNNSMEA